MNSPDDVAAVNAVNAVNAADTTDATDATDAAAVAAIAVNAASVPSVISNDVLSNDVPSNDIPRDNDKSEVEPVNRNTNANLTSPIPSSQSPSAPISWTDLQTQVDAQAQAQSRLLTSEEQLPLNTSTLSPPISVHPGEEPATEPVVEPDPGPESGPELGPKPVLEPELKPSTVITISSEQLTDNTTTAGSIHQDSLANHQHPQPYDQQVYQQQAGQLQDTQQQRPRQESSTQREEQDPRFDGLHLSPLPAATVAQHGLQALQAVPTTTSPSSDHLAQHYAQSATLQIAGRNYTELTDVANGNRNQTSPQGLHMHPSAHALHHGQPLNHGLGHSPSHMPVHHGSPNGISSQQKVTRLRRACDMCSQRKVKCDESGPPCKPCSDLNVECTFERQMKRRGPPNKHAEAARAAKRSRVDEPGVAVDMRSLSPPSSQQNGHRPPDAEAIAPWPVLELLVDDFFTYLHPLMPFPHEPTFRQAFAARADRTSSRFLALLSSMIGVLVASFPRSARAHLKAQHSADLFPTSITMIDRCRDIALQARGSLFVTSGDMTAEDAATSYFLGLAAGYIFRWKHCKRFFVETMSIIREVSVHRQVNSSLGASTREPTLIFNPKENKPIDHIKDQMAKRIFWVMMAGVRSMTQLGAPINELPLPPPTSQEQYPDQPVEVDDQYIFSDRILPQPEGVPSLMTGFNRNICVYTTMNELVGVDMCYGMKFFDWNAQKNILGNGLASAKQATEDLPAHLQVKTEPGQSEPPSFDPTGLQYYPPAFPRVQPPDDVRRAFSEQPMRRRQLQFEIQKANIYASSLATRSYFVERYLNLRDAERQRRKHVEGAAAEDDVKDERDTMVMDERELIVRNLLAVLRSISQHNMEPNGASIIHKIRQVASTLMNDAPERKGPVAVKAEEYLARFIEILVRLEKNGGSADAGPMTAQDEEDELRCWASLRDYQLEFAAAGGFLGQG